MAGDYKYGARRPDSEGEKTFVQGFPLFQWANGWPTTRRSVADGWVSQYGKFGEEFDLAMKAAGYETFETVQGNGTNRYWLVGSMEMFVVCGGLDGSRRMENKAERYGIGYGVHITRREVKPGVFEDIKDSKLQAVVFPTKLAAVGFVQPCLITARKMTGVNMVYALCHHYKTLDWLHEYAKNLAANKKSEEPDYPAYYAVAIEIGPGPEEIYTLRDGTKGRPTIPPTNMLPATFGEDKKATIANVQNRLIRRKDEVYAPVLEAIETPDPISGLTLMDEVISWAQDFSDRWTRDGDPFAARQEEGAPSTSGSSNTSTRAVAAPVPTTRNTPVPVDTAKLIDDDEDNDLPF